MSKFLCANLDKEEYLDFGEEKSNVSEGCAACKTLEYFLATEWNGDKIAFFFQDNEKSDFFPDEENAYDYITQAFTERSILNSTPKYAFVANITNKEYYFKAALPEGDDFSYVCPLPFVLSEKKGTDLLFILDEKESIEIGRWVGGNIVATNDVNFCKGYKLFESPYRVKDENPSAIKGLNIVVTGTLANFSRGGIENQIRKLGGNSQSSVTKKTDLVVVADYKPGTKKIADAKKYGIKMISEQEFFEMIGE